MALRETLVKFGIQVDGQEKLKQAEFAIAQVKTRAQGAGGALSKLATILAIGAVVKGVQNFIKGQIDAADALKHNAEKLGISTDELQKYQYAAQIMNVSTQETAVAMRFFNRAVGEASLGTKSAVKVFAGLGISVRDAGGQVRPTDDLLFEFSDKLQKIPSQAQRTAYAMRTLGRGGSALLPVLQKGSKALKEVFKDVDELGGGFNDEFVEKAHDVDVQLKRLKMGWRSVYVAIASEVLPVVKRWTTNAIHTVKTLIDLSKRTYAFRTALVTLGGGAVIFAIKKLVNAFVPAKMSLMGFLASLLANWPLVLFAALVVVAAIAVDDLYTFLKGGKSIIGEFLDQVGGKGTSDAFLISLRNAFGQIWDTLKPLLPELMKIGAQMVIAFVNSLPYIIKWGGTFVAFVLQGINVAVSGLKTVGTLLVGVFKAGKDYIMGHGAAGDKDIEKAWQDVMDESKSFAGRADAINGLVDVFQSIPTGGLADKPAPSEGELNPDTGGRTKFTGAGGGNTINVTNNINGAGDPHATGKAVSKATVAALKDAAASNRDAYTAVGAGNPSTVF